MITAKKIERMAEEFEAKAATLRATIALLNGDARPGKIKRMASVVGAAIQARASRNGHGARPAASKTFSGAVKAKREETLRALAIVAERGPMTSEAIAKAAGVKAGWIGPMVSRGYLVGRKGGEYKRTKKAFEVQPGRS